MKKLSGKTNNILAGVLSLALLLGVFAAVPEVKADTGADDEAVVAAVQPRATTSYRYYVTDDNDGYFEKKYTNPNSQNAITLYIFAKPDSPKDSTVLVEVYNTKVANENFVASKKFMEGQSGDFLKVSVPKNTTYIVRVTT